MRFKIWKDKSGVVKWPWYLSASNGVVLYRFETFNQAREAAIWICKNVS